MADTNELTAKLKAAAQDEIMCREACDTSDAWHDAVSPENVLALVEALEAENELNKHLELAIRKAEGCSEALRRRAESAEKRIAELEARTLTVKLPGAHHVTRPSMKNIQQAFVNGEALGRKEVLNAFKVSLAAAGISLKIEGEE